VVTATLSVDGFVDGWTHCQHVADYLARFAASDRFDPAQLTTRLSTYLNEVLELVYRSEPPAGDVVVAIYRLPERLQVEVRCPLASAADGADRLAGAERLRRSVRRASDPAAAATYRRGFLELLDGDHDGDAGLLELVALHGIKLELREASDAMVVRLQVPHE
jgi:hypothetical protein